MPNEDCRFQINTPNIVCEVIDGEAIIINTEKGCYFSLRNTGTEIWVGVAESMSVGDIVNKLFMQYEGELKDIEQAVKDLVAQLQDEEMIIPITSENSKDSTLNNVIQITAETRKTKFEIPVLEKYTDLEDLLLLDPIHEADETGWPNK